MKYTVVLISAILLLFSKANGQEIFMRHTQTIDASGGISVSRFYELFQPKWRDDVLKEYGHQVGYTAHVGIEFPYGKKVKPRFDLTLANYGGSVYVNESSSGGSYYTEGEIKKTTLSLGFSLIHFTNDTKSINLISGPFVSGLLNENCTGTRAYQNAKYDLNTDHNPYNSRLLLGYRVGINAQIPLTEKRGISLQYAYGLSLTSDFAYYPKQARAGLHTFTVGFYVKRKKRNVA